MGQIISYICDVSGKSGTDKKDFIEVSITTVDPSISAHYGRNTIHKLVHREVALKLHLIYAQKDDPDPTPEPTLESQLMTLLKDYISELAYEAGTEGGIDAVRNRG